MLAIGNSRLRGFTLLELIVVLAIMGLLTAAIPMARDRFQAERRAKYFAQRLASDLRELRSAAFTTNVPPSLTVDQDGHSYRTTQGTVRKVPEPISISYEPPGNTNLDADDAKIRFFADGSSSGGNVWVSAGGHRNRVSIGSVTGRVSVE